MDLNFSRRKRERAIAKEVEAEYLREITSTTEAAPPELLAHHFALVCQRLDFMPDAGSTGRILRYTSNDIARKERALKGFVTALDKLPGAPQTDSAPRRSLALGADVKQGTHRKI